jgi:16S rRNA (adenine1518-N6/adenine1519-N6)-dimethyltransferase
MQTLSEIRTLLDERGLRPRRRLGQNFLHDQNHIRGLVTAAAVAPGDLVLEVGPGTGALTEALLERGAEVVCCEIDRGLAGLLGDRLGGRVTLVEGDCLPKGALHPGVVAGLGGRPFTLVANLPYQVASPLMVELLLGHPRCRGQFVTIQREVADRLLAEPRTKAWGPLTIIVGALATVRRIAVLPPTCFWPAPQVDSAMVAVVPREPRPDLDARRLARFVTGMFSKRRKQLGTIFGRATDWPAGIEPAWRPEALTVEQVVALWRVVDPGG